MKRDDIIAAALQEFGHRDYENASTNAIIEQSGTSKGTFYHHFNSKEDLYFELIRVAADEKVSFMQRVAAQEQTRKPAGNLFDLLRSQIEASIQFSVAYPELARFSAKVAKETSEDIRDKIDGIIGGKTYDLFSQLIRTNIEQNYLRSDLPEEFVTRTFLFMISHFNEFLLEMGVEIEVENMDKITAILVDYIEFIETGLGKRRSQ
jgi:TetR/AcrR family transcriptional regulator